MTWRAYTLVLLFATVCPPHAATTDDPVAQEGGSRNRVEGTLDLVRALLDQTGDPGKQVVRQVVREQLAGCHLVLAATTQHDSVSSLVLSEASGGKGVLLVNMESLFSMEEPARGHLLRGLWGEARLACRALIIDLTRTNYSSALRLLEASGLWRNSEIRVVVVGQRAGVEVVLLSPGLRNTLHAYYFAFDAQSTTLPPRQGLTLNMKPKKGGRKEGGREGVEVYRRCLYCINGREGVQLYPWNASAGPQQGEILPQEEPRDYMGHTFTVVTMPYFPFTAVQLESEEPGAAPPLLPDALDTRILNIFAAHLNFTYVTQKPSDGVWGLLGDDQNLTGIAGTLHRQLADFSLALMPTEGRMMYIEFSKTYTYDPMVIVSLKPQALPQHLSIIRPFTDVMWQLLVVSVMAWGVSLWLLQKAWEKVSGESGHTLSSAVFYSWGLLLEDSPYSLPSSTVAQVLVGWWLVFCMVITAAYRSSLIAFLTIQGRSSPIDSWQDLYDRDGWTWGSESMLFTSSARLFFTNNQDPALKHIYANIETQNLTGGLEKVLAGNHAFISWKYYVSVAIASRYTDCHGNHPFYFSKKTYISVPGYAWGYRRGAPFRRPMDMLKQRMTEAALPCTLLKDVMAQRRRVNKRHNSHEDQGQDGKVVLGLQHLQGAFYALLLGHGLAFLTLLGERLAYRRVAPVNSLSRVSTSPTASATSPAEGFAHYNTTAQ